MPKLTFTITSEAAQHDPKTTVPCVKSMQLIAGGPRYVFPPELQGRELHDSIFSTTTGKLAKKAVAIRGTAVTVNINLPADSYEKYVDEDDNPIFRETLLPMWTPPRPRAPVYSSTQSSSPQEDKVPLVQKTRSLVSIAKGMVLEKFGLRRLNAASWLDMFESECTRVKLSEDKRWQIIWLFLEGPVLDWYDSSRQTLDLDDWESWRDSFLDSFSNKGWSAARTAFAFRYIAGSLSEYALKKENLLINLHRNIDETMKIYLIVTGLPVAIQQKLDRSEVTSTRALIKKINALDLPSRSISNANAEKPAVSFSRPPQSSSVSAFSSLQRRNPCAYCKSKGYERFHPEENCCTKAHDTWNRRSDNTNRSAHLSSDQ